jgi:hypothetical protein
MKVKLVVLSRIAPISVLLLFSTLPGCYDEGDIPSVLDGRRVRDVDTHLPRRSLGFGRRTEGLGAGV